MKGLFAYLGGGHLKHVSVYVCLFVCIYAQRWATQFFLRIAWPHLLYRDNVRVGGELERDTISGIREMEIKTGL